jgi:hypothetical protein
MPALALRDENPEQNNACTIMCLHHGSPGQRHAHKLVGRGRGTTPPHVS